MLELKSEHFIAFVEAFVISEHSEVSEDLIFLLTYAFYLAFYRDIYFTNGSTSTLISRKAQAFHVHVTFIIQYPLSLNLY